MTSPQIELYADQTLQCGEGPVWHHDKNLLYWTDSGKNKIFSFSGVGEVDELSINVHVSSLAVHEEGGLVLCGKEGFFHLDYEGRLREVFTEFDGITACNINDIIADPAGRIFGGQEKFRDDLEYDTGFLFRVDNDGKAKIVEEGMHISNGMGFNPSAEVFYLIDTIPGNLYRYKYNVRTGDISDRKLLIKIDKENGLPDGMTVDSQGFLWIARWFGSGISRYDPDGKLEREIELPVAQPSSITFGGRYYNEIFVTSAAVNWETPLAPVGHDYRMARGGGVYRIIQDITGLPEYKVRVKSMHETYS